MKNWAGFTLTELMIVVAIIAILSAISYPTYLDSVRRARRTDAEAALTRLASQMEQYYSQNNTYATATIGTGTSTDVLSTATTPEGWYDLAISSKTASAYTLTATPLKDQVNDAKCGSLGLDSTGSKSETGTGTVSECWR